MPHIPPTELPADFALDGELWRERDGFEELSGMCQRNVSVSQARNTGGVIHHIGPD